MERFSINTADFNSSESPTEQEHLQIEVITSNWQGEVYVLGSTIDESQEEEIHFERPASLFDIRPTDANELEDVSERHDDYLYQRI